MNGRAASLVQSRQRRYDRERRRVLPRLARLGAGLASLLVAVGGIWLAFFYSRLTQDLPSVEALPALLEPPNGLLLQPTRLYDRTGQHLILRLENPHAAGHEYLPITPASLPSSIPPQNLGDNPAQAAAGLPADIVAATLAAADPAFWRHDGYTLEGLRLFSSTDQGQRTLAQRLVSELLLADEPRSLQRALRERLLAFQATRRFGRAKIIEWYLNSAPYGRLTYGVDAAARVYLDKPAGQLSLAEAALLAAVAEAPDLNPSDAPQAALERQKYVLKDLLDYRLASPAAVAQAAVQDLAFRSQERPGQALRLSDLQPQVAPAFAGLALRQLETALPYSELARGGLNIITSLDYNLQSEAACAAGAQVARLGNSPEPAACEAAHLLPSIAVEAARTDTAGAEEIPGSRTAEPALAAPLSGLTAEVVVLDPATGEILALVGQEPVNQSAVFLPAHPAGTIGTPMIYLTAFTRGLSPASLVWDLPPHTSQTGAPQESGAASAADGLALLNLDGRFHGPLRLRMAMANDYLQPAEAVLEQVGIENVLRTAAQLGWQPSANPRSQAANSLGLFAPLDLLQVSQAYGVMANRGILAGRVLETGDHSQDSNGRVAGRVLDTGQDAGNGKGSGAPSIQPAAILQVVDAAGRPRLDWRTPNTRPILTQPLAYLVTNVLADEAARWPTLGHPNPTETGHPAAVKLGRTPAGDSFWTVGYTSRQVIGVWMGPRAQETGGAGSAQPSAGADALTTTRLRLASAGLWHALTQYAGRGQSTSTWEPPAGVSLVKVCDPSGMLPTRNCPNVVEEAFLDGSEPIQFDRMYRSLPVNRTSQRLATLFTPQDQIEERAYFMVPPQAAAWAADAGLATPPDTYDTIPRELPSAPNVRIASPAAFAILRGTVGITGTATLPQPQAASSGTGAGAWLPAPQTPAAPAPEFDFYRIQVGQGLYPTRWFSVGDDQTSPQPGGPLAVWDTRGLNGLYAVQLMVVLKDQSVQRSTLLVTVDNTAPTIRLLSPAAGEEILAARRPRLVLFADVNDDLGIAMVNLSLDGKLLAAFVQPPYAISWSAQPGEHTLSIEAVDQAGNSSRAASAFIIK